MKPPTLYIFSGLPGSGKTTIAQGLSKALGIAYVRIDTIEQALRDLCNLQVEGEGYRLAYRVASDNLHTGVGVVADSCNPIDLTRDEWEKVASKAGAGFTNIEVTCSNPAEHRTRIEERAIDIAGHILPTWEEVLSREYHPWKRDRVIIDTAGVTPQESLSLLLKKLGIEHEKT